MSNEINDRPSYFSILTADVRYDKDLSASEKIFYSEITCLCGKDGYCTAGSTYFANLYDCDSRTIRKWISKLVQKKYIKVEYDESGKSRKIYIVIKSNISKINEVKKQRNQQKRNAVLDSFYNSIK